MISPDCLDGWHGISVKCLACMFLYASCFGFYLIHPESKEALGGKTFFFFFFQGYQNLSQCSLKKFFFSVFCSDHSEIHGTIHWQRIQVLVSVFVFKYSRRYVETNVLE